MKKMIFQNYMSNKRLPMGFKLSDFNRKGKKIIGHINHKNISLIEREKEKKIQITPPNGVDYVGQIVFLKEEMLVCCNRFEKQKITFNGFVINNNKKKENNIFLGEGISNVMVDRKNQIWIIYNDEGIFDTNADNKLNNFSENGIICMSREGNLIFWNLLQIIMKYKIPVINDCYAVNISSDNYIWLLYASERGQSLLRISENFEINYIGEFGQDIPDDMYCSVEGIWLIYHSGIIKRYNLNGEFIEQYISVNMDNIAIEWAKTIVKDRVMVGQTNNGTIYQYEF